MSKKNLIHCLYHIKTMFVYHSPRFRPTASTFPPPLVPVDTKERENTIYFSPLNTTTKKKRKNTQILHINKNNNYVIGY